MKTLLTLIFYLGSLSPVNPSCGCDETRSIESEIEQSDLVISGVVAKKFTISKSKRGADFKKRDLILIRYEIEVLKSYKGINPYGKFFLYSLKDSASCGLNLDTNEKFIFFAKKGTYVPSDVQYLLSTSEKKGYWVDARSKTTPYDVKMELEIEKSLDN